MPIYMDRHDLPGITLKDAAEAHHKDLELQNKYSCKAMTYWVDEGRGNAFCLIEAPNEEAVRKLHNQAHGLIPHQIIEVNSKLVNAFLGRIHDPEPTDELEPFQLIDTAYRVIMVIETSDYLNRVEGNQFSLFSQKFHKSVQKSLQKFEGKVIMLNNNSYLISFKSVTNAVFCALKIQSNFKYITPKFDSFKRILKLGLTIGAPVTEKEKLFEDAIKMATYMCEVVHDDLVISREVKIQYDKENHNSFLNRESIRVLKPHEEEFLKKLMDFLENKWNDPDLGVEDISREVGYSSSQLYRKLKGLSGLSPNSFLREYRLHKALKMLHDQDGNVSEVAFQAGFNSPAYFSKCFSQTYGILPSKYLQQHTY